MKVKSLPFVEIFLRKSRYNNSMKLYLSSFHLGNKSKQLSQLFKNKKVTLISNALDFSSDLERRKKSTEVELQDLRSVGLLPEKIDLRDYFGKKSELKNKLKEFGGIWVRGGNSFVLRRAMSYSGLDEILINMEKNNSFVYSGYSAGACVVTPTLKGIDLADDPQITPDGYQSEIIWKGLGLVDYSITPHYRSNHPESTMIEKSVEYFKKNKMPYKTLKDGEVFIEESL